MKKLLKKHKIKSKKAYKSKYKFPGIGLPDPINIEESVIDCGTLAEIQNAVNMIIDYLQQQKENIKF